MSHVPFATYLSPLGCARTRVSGGAVSLSHHDGHVGGTRTMKQERAYVESLVASYLGGDFMEVATLSEQKAALRKLEEAAGGQCGFLRLERVYREWFAKMMYNPQQRMLCRPAPLQSPRLAYAIDFLRQERQS